MRRASVCALVLSCIGASTQAADLESFKDPLPDNLTWHGVTIYGTIDLGYLHNNHGEPNDGFMYAPDYVVYGQPKATGAFSLPAFNALTPSTVGFKFEENIGFGWQAIGKFDTGFIPLNGNLDNSCQALVNNAGKPPGKYPEAGDGVRCGEIFNGNAFAGVSHAIYGTLTLGRQNSLDLDAMPGYDPMAASYALSGIGWSGAYGTGMGSTEGARWVDSLKYVWSNGFFHAGVMYAPGGQDSSIHTRAYSVDAGFTYKGLSIDAVYANEKGVVNAYALPSYVANSLGGIISDDEGFSVMGKYVFNLGEGFKDGLPESKLTLYAGYQHSQDSNPTNPVAVGSTTYAGYILATAINTNFATPHVLETTWAGAKYELPSGWSFAGAYYRFDSGFYKSGAVTAFCSNNSHSNCQGSAQFTSALIDYAFNKHFDVYAGLMHNQIAGGIDAGSINNNNTSFVSGFRIKF